jgi:hypothetical protein
MPLGRRTVMMVVMAFAMRVAVTMEVVMAVVMPMIVPMVMLVIVRMAAVEGVIVAMPLILAHCLLLHRRALHICRSAARIVIGPCTALPR